jgi:hypothetical protein
MNLPFADSNLYPDRTQPADRPYEVEAVMRDECAARCPVPFLQDGVSTRRVILRDLELPRVRLTSCQG